MWESVYTAPNTWFTDIICSHTLLNHKSDDWVLLARWVEISDRNECQSVPLVKDKSDLKNVLWNRLLL